MYIPDEKIEEVRSASDVVDVVSDYVKLKRRGSNFVGLCPFHNEKTPSFNVNPKLGIFKCFGCGVGGDVFSFVQQIEHVEFPEAARMLAERAGVTLPDPSAEATGSSETEAIYAALRFAAKFFYRQLTQEPSGAPALDYLKRRGFTAATIKRFGLGYAPDRWDGLLTAAEEGQFSAEMLEKAGLVIPRRDGGGHYDRYRGRVIFPILSHVGKVLGFGGRILSAEADQPKYINSPETKVYNKSRVLYGLYQGKQAIRRAEEVLLVEGYTDIISLHQAGVEHVVASSGTALTAEQVKLLGRYAKRVLLLYDADAAGHNAALRGIDLILAHGLSAYCVALPSGEDPDSFARAQGGEAFQEYLREHRQDFVAFQHAHAQRTGALSTPEGQAEATRSIMASVAKIPDQLVREAYIRRAAEVLREPDLTLFRTVDQLRKERADAPTRRAPRPEPEPSPGAAGEAPAALDAPAPRAAAPSEEEKALIRLMLEHGAPMVEYLLGQMALDEFTPGLARQAAERFVALYEDDAVSSQPFLAGTFGEPLRDLAASLLVREHEVSTGWTLKRNIPVPELDEDPYRVADDALREHRKNLTIQTIKDVKHQIYLAGQDDKRVGALQARLMELIQYLRGLDPHFALKGKV